MFDGPIKMRTPERERSPGRQHATEPRYNPSLPQIGGILRERKAELNAMRPNSADRMAAKAERVLNQRKPVWQRGAQPVQEAADRWMSNIPGTGSAREHHLQDANNRLLAKVQELQGALEAQKRKHEADVERLMANVETLVQDVEGVSTDNEQGNQEVGGLADDLEHMKREQERMQQELAERQREADRMLQRNQEQARQIEDLLQRQEEAEQAADRATVARAGGAGAGDEQGEGAEETVQVAREAEERAKKEMRQLHRELAEARKELAQSRRKVTELSRGGAAASAVADPRGANASSGPQELVRFLYRFLSYCGVAVVAYILAVLGGGQPQGVEVFRLAH